MWYREYRVGRCNSRQLVIEIGYREGDRKIFYHGGLLAAGIEPKEGAPVVSVLVKCLPYVFPEYRECEVEPTYGFDLAIVSNEVLNVGQEFDETLRKFVIVIEKRIREENIC